MSDEPSAEKWKALAESAVNEAEKWQAMHAEQKARAEKAEAELARMRPVITATINWYDESPTPLASVAALERAVEGYKDGAE